MKARSIKQIPNLISIARLLLCPTIVYFLFHAKPVTAMVLFALACAADFLDGFLARRLHAQSAVGEILDPVCDKVFTLTFFSLLMIWGACPPWFVALLISASLFQGIGLLVLKMGHTDHMAGFGALPLGKWNMTFQFIWIGICLVDATVLHDTGVVPGFIRELGYLCLGGLQVLVFVKYFLRHRMELALHLPPSVRPA